MLHFRGLPRITTTTALALFVGGIGVACAAPAVWTSINRVHETVCRDGLQQWTICGLFYMQQTSPSPIGGPQGVEGYTVVNVREGHVGLAMGALGNVEQAGEGSIGRIVALQGGIVVNGPGGIGEAVSLNLPGVLKHGDYTGPVNVAKQKYIQFGNGWSFRPDGADLLLCDWAEQCQRFAGTPR